MADERALPPGRVPTLTEVVTLSATPALPSPPLAPAAPAPPPAAIDPQKIVDQVLAELQQRIDLMFEYRVREALAPVLARVADTMIHEARDELARTLRDIVARAVTQEISKQRSR